MTIDELRDLKLEKIKKSSKYGMIRYDVWDYSILYNILNYKRSGAGGNQSFNDIIIMADTETSKKYNDGRVYHNHVCAWTISLRAYHYNIVTLYGNKPSEFIDCITEIQDKLQGEFTIIYFHNLSYDWVFLRRYILDQYGKPDKQLNTKPHFPIFIQWTDRGLILKDSLILAQRSLDKWAKDLKVDHQKAIGKWDYDLIRNQDYIFNSDELEYIEHDTLAGVECIDATMQALGKHIYAIPYTATGIPREEVRKRGKEFHAHTHFLRMATTYEVQQILEMVYHGGFTHGNRHLINLKLCAEEDGIVKGYDFASSYPYCLLAYKYPAESFTAINRPLSIYDILADADNNAYIFKLTLFNVRLIDDTIPMPFLQYSKCTYIVNEVLDNGRILKADYLQIYITEQDAKIIKQFYKWDAQSCTDVYFATKEYLPRWFTDYVYHLFRDKTLLKGGDPILYAIAKAKLNSLYGLCVQRPLKPDIIEDYDTGDFTDAKLTDDVMREMFEKYLSNHNSILPYSWGVYCTAYATVNLFALGSCAGEWVYSDTDSVYGIDFDVEKINEYNNHCKELLQNNGYGAVNHNGREYWLGIAEHEDLKDDYSEFKIMGAKRYCGRCMEDNQLHITVAGVPKKGAECLHNDINNFAPNLIFSGNITGKKTHTYFFNDAYVDQNGNETADSIDLSPCDYLLQSVNVVDWDQIFTDEVEIEIAGLEE